MAYCTSKKEWVNISIDSKDASALSDYQQQFIPGRISCSGNDGTCDEHECLIQKMISEIKASI